MKKLAAALLALLGFMAVPSHAQAANTVTLSISVAPGNLPTATWAAPWAVGCTPSGNWSGSKANSGSLLLPALTATATYGLTCTSPADTTATLNWTAPTTNTDGTPLTDLAGFNVYSGLSAATMKLLVQVKSPTTLTYQSLNQPAGVNYYYVTAYNTAGVESAKSATVNKTFGGPAQSASASLTLTVPGSPPLTISTP